MPVTLDAEWIPCRRFSILEFNAPIEPYFQQRKLELSRTERESTSEFEKSIRGRYYSHELGCRIHTVGGAIHQIQSSTVCNYSGYNIVGSKISAVTSILGYPDIEWEVPHPDDPMERVGRVEMMGLELDVPDATGAVFSVVLRPYEAEWRAREQWARRKLGNITNIDDVRWGRRIERSVEDHDED